jgi:hypothetical protein
MKNDPGSSDVAAITQKNIEFFENIDFNHTLIAELLLSSAAKYSP